MIGQKTFWRTAAVGGLAAAMIGCAAGQYLRPELDGPRPGQTLVVTERPTVEFASFDGLVTPDDEHAFSLY